MRLVFTTNGWEDYTHWLQADRQVLKRINRLIDDALRDRQEHKVKGHSFTFPKFQVVEQELPATQTA